MPSTQVPHERSNEISWIVQAIAWSLGLVACLAGMLGRVSEWDSNLATVQFLWLLLAPIVMSFPKRRLGGKLDTAEVTQ
ncbi:MAG: hypothetical protein FJ267_15045, partial [Planctomycetes bacterium]|nr:hypothetical protein [Planctomycetota bacterium]